jgi:hypothetical protein
MFKFFRRKKPSLNKSSALYNEIGAVAIEQIGQVETKVLVYAEYIDDVMRSLVRHATNESKVVHSLADTDRVNEAIWNLLSHLERSGKEHVWKSMEYVVNYGEVDATLLYEHSFAGAELSLWEKSPKLLEKHFPGKPHR